MLKSCVSRWGPCTYFAKDEYVGKSLHYYGEYNPDETEMILRLAGHGLCLDIGANIGCISMALIARGHDVIAFEPQPEVAKVLRGNVSCWVEETALGMETGFAIMPKVHYSEKGNFGGIACYSSGVLGNIKVPIKCLDSYEFNFVSFIKIDVEGLEREVLLGGMETIKKWKPNMYIEDDREYKSVALRKLIMDLGYTIAEHNPTLYREDNFRGFKRNVWDKNYVSKNLVCVPSVC